MATSRDDFVIAIRSAFLKKGNKQRFSLVALIIFSVVLIVLSRINFPAINYLKIGLNEVVYRVSFIVSLPEQQLNRSLIAINNHLNLYNDHDQLKEKFKTLRGKELDNEYLKFENERLRKIIDEYIINTDELVAKVLLDKESPFLRSIILNKGSKDKIRIGMAMPILILSLLPLFRIIDLKNGLSLSKRTFATNSSVLIIYSSIIFLSLSFSNFKYSLSNSFPLKVLNFSFSWS